MMNGLGSGYDPSIVSDNVERIGQLPKLLASLVYVQLRIVNSLVL